MERACESGEQAIYLGTIIARDFAKAFVAIDNREVDDLSVRQEKTAVSCEQKETTNAEISSCVLLFSLIEFFLFFFLIIH